MLSDVLHELRSDYALSALNEFRKVRKLGDGMVNIEVFRLRMGLHEGVAYKTTIITVLIDHLLNENKRDLN